MNFLLMFQSTRAQNSNNLGSKSIWWQRPHVLGEWGGVDVPGDWVPDTGHEDD